VRTFPGDHFFLHKAEPQILEIIAAQLATTPPQRLHERASETRRTTPVPGL
jgi:surfactin synthase thioesterase subunit